MMNEEIAILKRRIELKEQLIAMLDGLPTV